MIGFKAAAVGAFVIAGILLFAAGIFLIGDRRMLFSDTFEVYTQFANIAGLEEGAKVRVAGMDAGEVETIHVPPGPSAPFRVKLRVREDLHPIIRVDSVATIQTDGLVGNKFVQVDAGTDQAQTVPPGGTIHSREPFDLSAMLQRMNETVDLVAAAIEDLKVGLDQALGSITDTAKQAQGLMNDLGAQATTIMASAQKVSRDLTAIVSSAREGKGTVGKFLTDDSLYVSAKALMNDAEKAVANLREASSDAKGAIADLRGGNGPMKGITGDLQQTLNAAKDAMSDLSENTEALKRNFFFRGFFNRRGYFDLEDVSVQQYRQGALATKDRHVLRIWVPASVLFERNAEGTEVLSDRGRIRLDSAMSTFVRYPRNTPFVIEGYAREVTGDLRFLVSRSRAQLVRDYIVGKFGLDGNYVAVMPMGEDAVDAPSGNRWDGVALALFVATSAM
jgi:phospholipid/cholesterol/gamma-HCH transport system substrate-binding protein